MIKYNVKFWLVRRSFLCYRDFYNWLGRLRDAICYLFNKEPSMLPSFLWIDLRAWHSVPEHPCHRAKKYVKDIFIATGMKPKKEHMHLLDE